MLHQYLLAMGFCVLGLPSLVADWPAFRGPTGDGHVAVAKAPKPAGLPLHWNEKENVRWKTAIPERGWSTPVVRDNRVWLTTASADGHDFFVLCVDAVTGRILVNKKLFHAEHPEPLGNDVNCYASPSPAIERGRVYVHFGSYGTACLDTVTAGVIWQRSDLPCRHFRGPGSSVILFQNLLILTMDGVDVQYLVALNKATGRTVWKTDRTAQWDDLGPDGKPRDEGDLRKAYTTPLVMDVDGKPQLLSIGSRAAYGYDPLTGREIWKIRHGGFSCASGPLFAHGVAFIPTCFPRPEMLAIRVDGQGDVTETHVLWRTIRGVPRLSSPVLADGLLYMAGGDGVLTCIDAGTGHEVWKKRIGGDYAASLLYANGRVYCLNQDGKTTVVKAGRSAEVLAINNLDAGFMASPAACGNALFLRTKTHLYRIEADKNGEARRTENR
jgi:outer membrane protein assembly factor BamB